MKNKQAQKAFQERKEIFAKKLDEILILSTEMSPSKAIATVMLKTVDNSPLK